MTDKQRFLVYAHLGNILAEIRKNNGVNITEAIRISLSKNIIQKLEDIETGYYLEGDGYLKREFISEK